MYQLTTTIQLEHAFDIVTFMHTYSDGNGILSGTAGENAFWVLVRFNNRYVFMETVASDCEQVRVRTMTVDNGKPVVIADEMY